jgi:hypothetical protein
MWQAASLMNNYSNSAITFVEARLAMDQSSAKEWREPAWQPLFGMLQAKRL